MDNQNQQPSQPSTQVAVTPNSVPPQTVETTPLQNNNPISSIQTKTTIINANSASSSKKGLLVVMVLVLILLAIAAGAYYFFNNYMSKQAVNTSQTDSELNNTTPVVAEMNQLETELSGFDNSNLEEDFNDVDKDLNNL